MVKTSNVMTIVYVLFNLLLHDRLNWPWGYLKSQKLYYRVFLRLLLFLLNDVSCSIDVI